MGEGFRNLTLLVWALCAVNGNAKAKNVDMIIAEEQNTAAPTVVFGAAKKPDGSVDEMIVQQPEGAPNPLGDPLQFPASSTQPVTAEQPLNEAVPAKAEEAKPSVFGNENPEALGKDFQNTLMEADGMVYDVQAYPETDFKAIGNSADPETIYSPNVNP